MKFKNVEEIVNNALQEYVGTGSNGNGLNLADLKQKYSIVMDFIIRYNVMSIENSDDKYKYKDMPWKTTFTQLYTCLKKLFAENQINTKKRFDSRLRLVTPREKGYEKYLTEDELINNLVENLAGKDEDAYSTMDRENVVDNYKSMLEELDRLRKNYLGNKAWRYIKMHVPKRYIPKIMTKKQNAATK